MRWVYLDFCSWNTVGGVHVHAAFRVVFTVCFAIIFSSKDDMSVIINHQSSITPYFGQLPSFFSVKLTGFDNSR